MNNFFSSTYWYSNSWLTWGLGPILVLNLSFWITTCFLEWVIAQPWSTKYLLVYTAKTSRRDNLTKTQNTFSWRLQAGGSVQVLLGPTALSNALLGVFLLPWIVRGTNYNPQDLEWRQFLLSLLFLELVGDFFLYVGHRIQHDIPYLWKNYHSFHHQIDTPSPVSTLYIDPMDASLQGGLPIIISAFLHGCVFGSLHPLTFYIYIALRIGENVVNHSGLDCWWLDLVTLKCLPGRAKVSHHDAHHRFSSYGANAKNYGENFWVWDWMFGTLATRTTYAST
eukprot:TRINITY_DN13017_c0_g2_i1.p1 TRINITY_DN13017_c0_g2~~TRINITY_DN13017_c0_g2_i1.p1  ORF type:complete len:280 (-),score=19.22 TRINITY_DN13017_c0_g2_i1:73-912(-)